jgi:putative endonuclease
MHYVYILRSETHPDHTYIGSTRDLRARIAQHNSGKSIHTNKFKPWTLLAYVALPQRELADKFEKYLKSGSGRAFAGKHFLNTSG